MTPQTENAKQPKPTLPPEPEYKAQTRLSVVMFAGSIMFGTEMDSASVWVPGSKGQAPSNAVDSIELAWLNSRGEVISDYPQSDTPHGLVIRKRVHDLNTGRRVIRQTFVPWARVRSISYSD
jgi:hypothetical protein